jgi:hypothetical protein
MYVINLFGGPGTGKSRTAAGVFNQLKARGHNVESIPEYVKKLIWMGREHERFDQLYVLGKQHHYLWCIDQKVEAVVLDSPLLLSSYYGADCSPAFHQVVYETFARYQNINFYLHRVQPYNPAGRLQTEIQADAIEIDQQQMLNRLHVAYQELDADDQAPQIITDYYETFVTAKDRS